MRVSSVQNRPMHPSFKSCYYREVLDNAGNLLYRSTTDLFRQDLNWNAFAEYLIKKFANQEKVNLYSFACSDGSEPYSLAMMLISKLGEAKAKKFFPIIASDIDDVLIQKAKSGELELIVDEEVLDIYEKEVNDPLAIFNMTGLPSSTFFDSSYNERRSNGAYVTLAHAKDFLRNAVKFSTGNVINEIDHVEPKNSVVLFRNCWGYLNPNEQKTLLTKLGNNLGENSVFVIGDFGATNHSEIDPNELFHHGFALTPVQHCFEKRTEALTEQKIHPETLLYNFARTK